MSKPIDTLLKQWGAAAICKIKGHAWLSSLYGKRYCNRCGKKQERSPITQYKWTDVKCVIKPFNPVD